MGPRPVKSSHTAERYHLAPVPNGSAAFPTHSAPPRRANPSPGRSRRPAPVDPAPPAPPAVPLPTPLKQDAVQGVICLGCRKADVHVQLTFAPVPDGYVNLTGTVAIGQFLPLAALLLTWKAESQTSSLTFPPFRQVRMVWPSISIRHCLFVAGMRKIFSMGAETSSIEIHPDQVLSAVEALEQIAL